MTTRRGLLKGLAATLVVAPAIIRIESLMPISGQRVIVRGAGPYSIIGRSRWLDMTYLVQEFMEEMTLSRTTWDEIIAVSGINNSIDLQLDIARANRQLAFAPSVVGICDPLPPIAEQQLRELAGIYG